MTFALQKALFGSLIMVYDRVSDGYKFSHQKFGLGKPLCYATSHLKVEATIFFAKY